MNYTNFYLGSNCGYFVGQTFTNVSTIFTRIIQKTHQYSFASTEGNRWGCGPLWIFIHDTNKVEGGLMVLFFQSCFFVAPLPGNFSADTLVSIHQIFLAFIEGGLKVG